MAPIPSENGVEGDDEREEEEDDEDEEEEEEEEEEAGEEEEEEEEPRLKYQRMGGSIPTLLASDTASCIAVAERMIALGTHGGTVHILDFLGNQVKEFPAHTAAVNDLSFDIEGEYVGSCSDDGSVVINSLFTDEKLKFEYHRPMKAIALDPDYSRKMSRRFVTGGLAGHLYYNTKKWFGYRDQVLHSGEGPIHVVKWRTSLVAWANDAGVKVYDTANDQRITFIERPRGSPRPELLLPHLVWQDDALLVIGWGTSVKIASIRTNQNRATNGTYKHVPMSSANKVDIVASFQTSYFISGVAPFGDSLVVLAYILGEEDGEKEFSSTIPSRQGNAQRPEVRIVSWNNDELSTDALPVHGFEHYKAKDYSLAHAPFSGSSYAGGQWAAGDEPLYYIVSLKDVVIAKPRDAEDHIAWLLQHGWHEKALAAVEAGQGRSELLDEVGSRYLDHLIVERKYAEAASLCPKLLRGSASAWERWVFHFAHLRQLPVLVPYMPTDNPRLRDTAYEVALVALATNSSFHKELLSTVKSWPHVIYSALPVISAIEPQLNTSSMTDALKEALAELYVIDGQYEKAFSIYADLMKPVVFDFIEKHNLQDAIQEKVVQLMTIDCKHAVPLLIQNKDVITPSDVVSQLLNSSNKCDNRYFLHLYLHSLFEVNPHSGKDFHDMQVELYADYDPKMLLTFLRSSQHYTLEKAYETCIRRDLLREQVFILGRMGNSRQALAVIINKLGDIEEAVEFVTMQHDDDLWEELIKQCLNKPEMVGVLLEHTVGNLDPLYIVNMVPNGLEIPRLRDRLVKIITDYRTETSLRHGCNDILKADCVNLLVKYYKEARHGIYLSNEEEARAKRNDSSASQAIEKSSVRTTEIEEDKMEEIAIGYFGDLFSTSNPVDFSDLLLAVQPKVTHEMNNWLVRPFVECEVNAALKQMYPLKAPGPDGMPPLFFQHFWSTSRAVVTKTVLDFLNFGISPPNFNETHITLVPKIKEPKKITDYRPISLCNVVYKIASKAIANRLKRFLPSIISDTQSAFVHGRLITDNVLVAFETMHHISQKKGGKTGEMALKLDMSKTYDRVEWVWLDKVMEKLGFADRMRGLIMRCVSTVTYSIKINGTPRGHIIPSRGIRQGDPLSPYLFLLCAEGLSALIQSAVDRGQMEGVKICRGSPRLSHLFFADDSLIFCKATLKECDELQRLLAVYEKASGQQLNRAKTSLFFSGNTPREVQEEIKNRFGAQIIKQHEKYLGLPSLVGRNKRTTFNAIKEKLGKVLAGWKEKLLSKAGKEVLIKAVAQAIPTYTMSCFKIPDSLCDDLMGMIRNFWWGQKKEEKKIAWLSWEKMCEPKCDGGMGFKNLKWFNKALLAKQGWHLQMGGNSLLYRVLKAKYFPTGDFVHASIGHNPSYTWRSLISAQRLVIEGLRWRVGNGANIKVWQDRWLPWGSSHSVISPRIFLSADTKVADLIDSSTAKWKSGVIDSLFIAHEAELIKKIPLSATLPADKLVWAETTNGNFTVKSAYNLAARLFKSTNCGTTSDGSSLRKFWKKLWSLPIPHKVRHFCWCACRDTLPTKVKLRRRNVIDEDMCVCCKEKAETNGHIFWGCQKAQEAWAASKVHLLPLDVHIDSFQDLLWYEMMTNAAGEEKCSRLVMTAWALWCNRNDILHRGEGKTGPAVALWAATYLQEYWSAIETNSGAVSNGFLHLSDTQMQSAWLPPSTGSFKINVDGAFYSTKNQAGIGVVIRDSQGRLMAALCRKIKAPLQVLEVEAKAYEAGMLLARHLGLQDGLLEGDSLTISNALKGISIPPTYVAAIVEGIHFIGAEIDVVNFSHVRRSGNKPAHILARQALSYVNDVIWIEEIPSCIQQALIQDVIGL